MEAKRITGVHVIVRLDASFFLTMKDKTTHAYSLSLSCRITLAPLFAPEKQALVS